MAQEIVNTFKELVDRLKEANKEGGLLERVKLIEASTKAIISANDLPVITYELLDIGITEERCMPRHNVFTNITVQLLLFTAQSDGYYQTETRSGVLDYIEKIMNVINGTQAIDLRGNNHWGTPEPKFRVRQTIVNDLKFETPIEVILTSVKFEKGQL